MHRIFHSVTYIMPRKLRFCRKKNWEIQKQAKKLAKKARQREDQITDVRTVLMFILYRTDYATFVSYQHSFTLSVL